MPTYTLTVNGQNHSVTVFDPNMALLFVLRDVLNLTGTKYGCGQHVCGACTVLIDNTPRLACVTVAQNLVGHPIVTIEGLSSPNGTHPAQVAWVANQVPQCGFCQPGMIMACAGLMNEGNHGANLVSKIQNICICGTYKRIKQAVSTL